MGIIEAEIFPDQQIIDQEAEKTPNSKNSLTQKFKALR